MGRGEGEENKRVKTPMIKYLSGNSTLEMSPDAVI